MPTTSFSGSTVAPAANASVPSLSMVASVRFAPSVREPVPVFVSWPAVGAEIVAETPGVTETSAVVRAEEPVIRPSAENSIFRAITGEVTAAEAFAFVK